MARILAVIAPVLLLVPPARPRQIDSTLGARLRSRFVGPEGNRAVAVAGEPGNPQVAYVGAASGGIWKTEDGGVHWRAVFDSQPAQAIGAIALAPSAHNVLWAGAGETFFIRSTTALGNGVYRSTDGGRSWQHQGLDATGRIARIVIHPANPDVVLVCALGRAYGPAQDRGVYRTTDGGKTWSRVLFVDPNTGCSDLALDPGDPYTLFAGMWQFEVKTWHLQSGGPGSGLWGSRDAGASISLHRGRTFMRIVLPIAQMYHVHVDTRAPYFVYGNRQGGSSYRMPSRGLGEGISEGAWQHVGGCESGFGIPDTVDNASVWSGCYDGGLEVYDVRTGHARNVRVWPEAGYGWRPADLKYRWNWTFPIMISPHDHRRVYVGSQYVHLTTDGGASWKG